MSTSEVQLEPLAVARSTLQSMLESADLIPDSILGECDRVGRPYKFNAISSWESKDKLELFDIMFAERQVPQGTALLVTDSSFASGYVQKVRSSELRSAVADSDDFIFDGDVVLLFPEGHCLSVFHHGGGFAHIGW